MRKSFSSVINSLPVLSDIDSRQKLIVLQHISRCFFRYVSGQNYRYIFPVCIDRQHIADAQYRKNFLFGIFSGQPVRLQLLFGIGPFPLTIQCKLLISRKKIDYLVRAHTHLFRRHITGLRFSEQIRFESQQRIAAHSILIVPVLSHFHTQFVIYLLMKRAQLPDHPINHTV